MIDSDAKISEFQRHIEELYGEKDMARGTAGTFMWFVEEVGELSRALKKGDRGNLEEEFADVFAWMTTLASMHGVELDQAVLKKYGPGTPRYEEAMAEKRARGAAAGGPMAGDPMPGDSAAGDPASA